jgi:hypothetical protein
LVKLSFVYLGSGIICRRFSSWKSHFILLAQRGNTRTMSRLRATPAQSCLAPGAISAEYITPSNAPA